MYVKLEKVACVPSIEGDGERQAPFLSDHTKRLLTLHIGKKPFPYNDDIVGG
jgi:hypothetical protein